MASEQSLSFNLGLSPIPESKDPMTEIMRLLSAVRGMAQVLDTYTGAQSFPEVDWPELSTAQTQRVQFITRGYCQFTETVLAGHMLNLYNTGATMSARLANATDNTKPARAFAFNAVTAGNFGEYMLLGAITNFSSLVPGALYYLSTSGGLITGTKPVGVGNLQQAVGFALSSSVLFFNPALVENGVVPPDPPPPAPGPS